MNNSRDIFALLLTLIVPGCGVLGPMECNCTEEMLIRPILKDQKFLYTYGTVEPNSGWDVPLAGRPETITSTIEIEVDADQALLFVRYQNNDSAVTEIYDINVIE